jgi:hypothetical protein
MPSVPENSIYVIAVPTPLDSHNKPDLTFLSSAFLAKKCFPEKKSYSRSMPRSLWDSLKKVTRALERKLDIGKLS